LQQSYTPGLADGYAARSARPQGRARPGRQFFKPLRQIIESNPPTTPSRVQLGLEHSGRHTPAGVLARILRHILALTAATWHTTTPATR
jgi:hypothetical protein